MKFKTIVDLHLFLTNDKGQLLLLRRYNTGYEDENYSVPAGHLEANESIVAGIIRETQEEIGINLLEDNVKLCHIMHRLGDNPRISLFFEVTSWEGEPVNNEPNKCDDLQWRNINDLPENMVEYVKNSIGFWQDSINHSIFGWN
ncbi:MAG: NUDIX domain-containing protein [Candidatus Rickettsia vulgarisii]